MSEPNLTRYHTSFTVTDGLDLGQRTHVEIVDLRSTRDTSRRSEASPYDVITAVATVRLTMEAAVGRVACAACKVLSPWPDDHDALWYLIENHVAGRIAFPRPADTRVSDQSSYPVKGWREVADGLYCGTCAVEVEAAIAATCERLAKR